MSHFHYIHRSANKCLTKVAHMSAQLQLFEKAASLFEEVNVLNEM